MRIVHLADIHVKDRRRAEYAAVFTALSAQLKAERPPPTVIAVAGDVFDTMSKASARNWEDVASLLGLLAEVAPVAIIPGNHDLNVRAAGSPDLIGPMLKTAGGGARNLQPPRVTYWRDSGVHEFAGAIWAVGIPGQPAPSLVAVEAALAGSSPETPLIGIYHESIGGARYPNGMVAEATSLSKNDLGELAKAAGPGRPCAILLGDVHLRQEIAFPGSGPAAAAWYPGSLVCQTFGEPHLGHGYLLWDLGQGPTGTSIRITPRDVPNPRAPLTIRLGRLGEDLTPKPRPERPRAYRVVHDPAAPVEAVAAVARAAAQHYGFAPRSVEAAGEAEATRNSARAEEKASDAEAEPAPAPLAAAQQAGEDWAQHAAHARALLAEANLPTGIGEAALARYEAAVARNLGLRAAAPRAELSRLEFDNMFCYGPGNVVDFDALRAGRPGLVGFVAPNRAGKSSLFDILTFALCDESPRGTKRDIPRRGSPGYRLRLTFRIDGTEGRLEKSGGRGELKRGQHMIKLWLGGQELTADTTPETATRIQKLLGNRQGLDAISVLRPTAVSAAPPFALTSAASRRQTISGLLDLGDFAVLLKKADLEIRELRGARKATLRSYHPAAAAWKEGEAAAPLALRGEELELVAASDEEDLITAKSAENKANEGALAARQAASRAATDLASARAWIQSLKARAGEAREEEDAARREEAAARDGLAALAQVARSCGPREAGAAAQQAEDARTALVQAHAQSGRARAGAKQAALRLEAALVNADTVRAKAGSPSQEENMAAQAAARARAGATQSRDQQAALDNTYRAAGLMVPDPAVFREAPASTAKRPAFVLGKTLLALATARREAQIHSSLRADLLSEWRNGCAGCVKTREALGGLAEDRMGVLGAEAAACYPAAMAALEGKVSGNAAAAKASEEQAARFGAARQKAMDAAAATVAKERMAAAASRKLAQDVEAVRAAAQARHRQTRAAAEQARIAVARINSAKMVLACAQTAAEAASAKTAAVGAELRPKLEALQGLERAATLSASVSRAAEHALAGALEDLARLRAAYHTTQTAYSAHVEAAVAAAEADRAVAVCAAYRKLLHPKHGVGARLLESAAAGVAAEVGAVLNSMDVSFTVEFGADYELTLVDGNNGTRIPPALGSGYQQFVIALAVRWALAKVARVPRPACFMIDEGFGCLDEKNLSRVAEALGAFALRVWPGEPRSLVLAVTHREDMAPYFAERLEIEIGDASQDKGNKVSYPAGGTANLESIVLHVPHALPPRRCEACSVNIGEAFWAAHVASARHHAAMAATRGQEPKDGFCAQCGRVVALNRRATHGDTAGHIKAAAACTARDELVASSPGIGTPAPGSKIACLLCPASSAFTIKQWARHVGSAKHVKSECLARAERAELA